MLIRLPEGGVGEHQLEGAAESKHHGLIIDYDDHDFDKIILITMMMIMIFTIMSMIMMIMVNEIIFNNDDVCGYDNHDNDNDNLDTDDDNCRYMMTINMV